MLFKLYYLSWAYGTYHWYLLSQIFTNLTIGKTRSNRFVLKVVLHFLTKKKYQQLLSHESFDFSAFLFTQITDFHTYSTSKAWLNRYVQKKLCKLWNISFQYRTDNEKLGNTGKMFACIYSKRSTSFMSNTLCTYRNTNAWRSLQ
jgi:hypothetical protein